MSLLMSATIWAPSLRANTASSECCWMDSRSRAGCPRRSARRPLRARRSTRLSTAMLEGAQHRTWGRKAQGRVWGFVFKETTSVYTEANRKPLGEERGCSVGAMMPRCEPQRRGRGHVTANCLSVCTTRIWAGEPTGPRAPGVRRLVTGKNGLIGPDITRWGAVSSPITSRYHPTSGRGRSERLSLASRTAVPPLQQAAERRVPPQSTPNH